MADHEELLDLSPYNAFDLNPIRFNDPDGDCTVCPSYTDPRVGEGIVAAATDAISGIVNVINDPVGSAVGIFNAIANPVETVNAIKDQVVSDFKEDPVKASAKAFGNVLIGVATAGVGNEAKGLTGLTGKTPQLIKAEQRAAKLSLKQRPGKDFTQAGKEAVKDVNKAQNSGKLKCTTCGNTLQNAKQHKTGVTPSKKEAHVDHIKAKSKGGSGTPDNGDVKCRGCNLKKGSQ
jgi:5-methylcytosine-specific restriction endonuclease McrA